MIPQGLEPEEAKTGENEIEEMRKALAAEKAEAEANLSGWQRERADFLNYKRRVEQEREEVSKSANAGLMLRLLPVLDDFDRALNCIPPELADLSWVEGIGAIERKLRTTLETQGLSPIEAVGKPFDPNEHEAVMQGEGEENMVVGELQKGYKLYDKVLRPTKAIVGCGKVTEKEE